MGERNQRNSGNNNPRYRNIPSNKRPQRKRRITQDVPPTVIAIYVVMALLILAICAVVFVVTFKKSTNNSDSSGVSQSSSSVTSSIVPDSSSSVNSSDVPVESTTESSGASSESSTTSTSSTSSSVQSTDSASSTASSSGSEYLTVLPTKYNKEFFANDLFIGDSIFTGLSGYGFLDAKNVAAKIGYTPSGAMNKAFDAKGVTAVDYAKQMQPKRIFLMLGSNTMSAGTNFDSIVSQYSELVKKLRDECPKSLICVISIPPVTSDSSAAKTGNITNENIRMVNQKLKTMAASNSVDYLDLNKMFSDGSGCFRDDLAEQDGLHFMGSTYKIVLSVLERELSGTNTEYYTSN